MLARTFLRSAILLALAPWSRGQLVLPLLQVRNVSSFAVTPGGPSNAEQEFAVDFGPFLADVGVASFASGGESAAGAAEQDSTIESSMIEVNCSNNGMVLGIGANATSDSEFSLLFQLTSAARYDLTAIGESLGDASAIVTLLSLSGDFVLNHSLTEKGETTIFSHSGVLHAGNYRLSVFTGLSLLGQGPLTAASSSIDLDLEWTAAVPGNCLAQPNSTGVAGTIYSSGIPNVSAGSISLLAGDLPANVAGLFLYGDLQPSVSFGDGVLCLGLPLIRFPFPSQSSMSGTAQAVLDFNQPPFNGGPGAIFPGSTWSFQHWFRDPNAMGAGWNTTNALTLTFQP